MKILLTVLVIYLGYYVADGTRIRRWKRDLTFGIFPGTKWCGMGSIAKNDNDLARGQGRHADVCCRTHDKCPDYVDSFRMHPKYGVFNPLLYRISSCECDQKFFGCLTKNADATSDGVGHLYFNVLPTFCFDKNGRTHKYDYVEQVKVDD